MQIIRNFYNQYVSYEDRLFFCLFSILSIVAFSFLLINKIFTHYHGFMYVPVSALAGVPVLLFIAFLGFYLRDSHPKIARIFVGYGLVPICLAGTGFLADGVQFTPFPTIDHQLIALDSWLHISTNGILNWTYSHPILLKSLEYFYNSITWQLIATPFILLVSGQQKQYDRFICACLVAWIIGFVFYYFFPALGPAAMFNNQHFAVEQHVTAAKFLTIHEHLPFKLADPLVGGMVVFPSFHVIWASLIIFAFSCYSYWLFIPALLINLIVIASTVLLGWHYAVDIIGGVIVTGVSVYLSHYLLSKVYTQ